MRDELTFNVKSIIFLSKRHQNKETSSLVDETWFATLLLFKGYREVIRIV